MKENKRNRIITIVLAIAMTVAILFAVITSVVVYQKQQELADLKDKNGQIEDIVKGEGEKTIFDYQENQIILKKI